MNNKFNYRPVKIYCICGHKMELRPHTDYQGLCPQCHAYNRITFSLGQPVQEVVRLLVYDVTLHVEMEAAK